MQKTVFKNNYPTKIKQRFDNNSNLCFKPKLIIC